MALYQFCNFFVPLALLPVFFKKLTLCGFSDFSKSNDVFFFVIHAHMASSLYENQLKYFGILGKKIVLSKQKNAKFEFRRIFYQWPYTTGRNLIKCHLYIVKTCWFKPSL